MRPDEVELSPAAAAGPSAMSAGFLKTALDSLRMPGLQVDIAAVADASRPVLI